MVLLTGLDEFISLLDLYALPDTPDYMENKCFITVGIFNRIFYLRSFSNYVMRHLASF